MRIVLGIIATLLFSGCLHTNMSMSGDEECALDDMIFAGRDRTTGVAQTYKKNFEVDTTVSKSSTVRCDVPKSEIDECGIDDRKVLALKINRHNSDVKTKNFIIGVGYLYVIPGLLGYMYWEPQTAQRRDEYISIRNEIAENCRIQGEDTKVAH